MEFKTSGTCAVKINFDVEENKVKNLKFTGGCEGNHKGLSSLIEGMEVDVVVRKLSGLTCGKRNSSCPDQLAQALTEYKMGRINK